MGCSLDSDKISDEDEDMKSIRPHVDKPSKTYATLPKAFVTKPNKPVRPPDDLNKKQTVTWKKLLLLLVGSASKQV